MEKTLQEQLLSYYTKTSAASDMYYAKSDRLYELGIKDGEKLSAEGIGGYIALGGLAAKLAYSGAQFANAISDLPQGFSDFLYSASLPFNAVAGTVFAAGAAILGGTVIKNAAAAKIADNANVLSEHSIYASAAYHGLEKGSLQLPEGATVEDAIVAARDQQVEEYLNRGGDQEDVEHLFEKINFEKVDKLVSKLEKNEPEAFAVAQDESLQEFQQSEAIAAEIAMRTTADAVMGTTTDMVQ